jgi:hypothetical protein
MLKKAVQQGRSERSENAAGRLFQHTANLNTAKGREGLRISLPSHRELHIPLESLVETAA